MIRSRNTNFQGGLFSTTTIDAVWNKGHMVPNYSPEVWRYDICGMPIKYTDYGRTDSLYGWEIDHIMPVSRGGSDTFDNLQPLQWESNRRKGDIFPWAY